MLSELFWCGNFQVGNQLEKIAAVAASGIQSTRPAAMLRLLLQALSLLLIGSTSHDHQDASPAIVMLTCCHAGHLTRSLHSLLTLPELDTSHLTVYQDWDDPEVPLHCSVSRSNPCLRPRQYRL